jgi:hypothetical protein
MDVRNAVYRTLYNAVAQSAQQGLPVAGAAACNYLLACVCGWGTQGTLR